MLCLVKIQKVLKINNLVNESLYQSNLDFSKFNTKYKILAIYYPLNYINKITFEENENTNEKEEINLSESLIEQQIKLAKIHGIFGYGIVYNLNKSIKSNEEIFNIFSNENLNNFSFFMILKHYQNYNQQNQTSLNEKKTFNEKNISIFIDSFRKYFTSKNYIKFRGKPILGIFHCSFTNQLIHYIRNYENKNENGSIYIISIFSGKSDFGYLNLTNSFVEFPSQNIGLEKNISKEYIYNYYYPNLITNKGAFPKNITNFFVVNGCRPEKFYIISYNVYRYFYILQILLKNILLMLGTIIEKIIIWNQIKKWVLLI